MGFGSYDESEQDNQEIDTDFDEDESLATGEAHRGEVNFEFEESNDELLNRLEEMKD
ncbi:DUF5786 family protein [Halomarina litorea]|uniref:DUF5786 family protein n=1 Tax=Halomarina litorea TaxID=2961595 RepID=UPI0020C491C2|nr:DUF5786 family protein [Halomarina sp. BCD28]